jgi:hypothetical protein
VGARIYIFGKNCCEIVSECFDGWWNGKRREVSYLKYWMDELQLAALARVSGLVASAVSPCEELLFSVCTMRTVGDVRRQGPCSHGAPQLVDY